MVGGWGNFCEMEWIRILGFAGGEEKVSGLDGGGYEICIHDFCSAKQRVERKLGGPEDSMCYS